MNEKKLDRKNTVLVVLGLIVAAAVTIGAIVFLNNLPRSLGTSDPYITQVNTIYNRDLVGTWHSEDDLFSAKVSNGEIDLRINGTGGNTVLWYGTFDSNPKQTGMIIESKPVIGKEYWSIEGAKNFTYKEDRLYFDFTAPGVSKTVVLVRG